MSEAHCGREFEGVHDAWIGSVATLLELGSEVPAVAQASSVGSGFGNAPRPSREIIASSFSIADPTHRLVQSACRPLRIGYALGNFLYAIQGESSLSAIQFYNERAVNFSDDGAMLAGTFGSRVFHSEAGNQLSNVARLLEEDPSSRRAVIQVFQPQDVTAESRNCSCLTHLQFFLRDGSLSCIASMRSQSVLMVMPYDLILHTLLQEALAVHLGLQVGRYYHICGSFHYYMDEERLARQVVAEWPEAPPKMPSMTSFNPTVVSQLAAAEESLRLTVETTGSADVPLEEFNLDLYWREFLHTVFDALLVERRL